MHFFSLSSVMNPNNNKWFCWFITADDPYANNEFFFFLFCIFFFLFYRSSQCILVLISAINNEHITNKFDVVYLQYEHSCVDYCLESARRACVKLLAGKTFAKTLISNGSSTRQLRICTRLLHSKTKSICHFNSFLIRSVFFFIFFL